MANEPNYNDPASYKQWMSPEQYAKFQQLDAQFRAYFPWTGGGFNYGAVANGDALTHLTKNITGDPMSAPGKQQALDQMLNFWSEITGAQGQAGQKIPLQPLFDPLRKNVDEMAQQTDMRNRGLINQSARGATDRASEALAGTGLGRSGVAAQAFQGIEQQRQGQEFDAMTRVENERLRQQFELDMQQMQLEYQESLHERGWDEENVRSALEFQRQLQLLQFQQAANYEEEDWTDYLGPIASIVGTVATLPFGGIGGAAAGAAAGGLAGGMY